MDGKCMGEGVSCWMYVDNIVGGRGGERGLRTVEQQFLQTQEQILRGQSWEDQVAYRQNHRMGVRWADGRGWIPVDRHSWVLWLLARRMDWQVVWVRYERVRDDERIVLEIER